MTDQTRQLSGVLDALLQQQSSGKEQDSNSLNALLDTVLPSYLHRSLEQEEIRVILKIFEAVRLLLSRSPSLIIENSNYKKLLRYIKELYNSMQYPEELSDSANMTLSQIISSAFTGGKLRNNKYLLAIRDDLLETLEGNLKELLRTILSSDGNSAANKGVILYANEMATANDRKLAKLSVSVRILRVILDRTLRNSFMLHLQCSMLLDNFIRRTWFCIDNIVINLDLKDEEEEEDALSISQTSIPSIASKFDQLYSILLNSTVGHFYSDDDFQINHLDMALLQCKQLLNWALLKRFPTLQVGLAESLMKLLLRSIELVSISHFWNKTDLFIDKLVFINGFVSHELHQDLYVTLNLLLALNYSDIALLESVNSAGIIDAAVRPYVNKRLNSLRDRLLRSFTTSDYALNADFVLRLTNGSELIFLNHAYSEESLLEKVNLSGKVLRPGSSEAELTKWLHSLKDQLNRAPDVLLKSQIGKLYVVNSLGKLACLLCGDYDFEKDCCSKCDCFLDESCYIQDVVNAKRADIDQDSTMKSAFEVLMNILVGNASQADGHLTVAILTSLVRIFRSFRAPPLSGDSKLWSFLQGCFVSVIREVRLLTVKLLPLILYCPNDLQYETDFDLILTMLNSFKPTRSTAYLFEGIIMTWGELLSIARVDPRYYVLLNPIIQFMGDSDEFRSNLAIHELRLVSATRKVTPWNLVQPFIPLISCDLIQRRGSSPGLLDNFCICLNMSVPFFLKRTQMFVVPRIVQSFDNSRLLYMANEMNRDQKSDLVGTRDLLHHNLVRSLAMLLTSEDVISPSKIMKILRIFDKQYAKWSFEYLMTQIDILSLIWELLRVYNCTEEVRDRIRMAIIFVCSARHDPSAIRKSELEVSNFLDNEMNTIVLGMAQFFSNIIHNNVGNTPFLEKIQSIRAIRCLTELSHSFETCLSQIMTCLQIALESPELQYESLECLRIIVANLTYSQLSIIVDLIISYLIQKYSSFSPKCKSISKSILKDIFQKDANIFDEHPSYAYSLASSDTDLNELVARDFRTSHILREFTTRLQADNKWIVSQVLDDLLHFFEIRQVDLQKTYIGDTRNSAHLSSLLSNLLEASNRFSVTCIDIPKKCSFVLSMIGALDFSKFASFFHKRTKNLVLVSNLTKEGEVVEFTVHFLNSILVKCFVASTDPHRQIYLAYAMQEHLRILHLSPEDVEKPGKECSTWLKFSNLSQAVLKPLLNSKYIRNTRDRPTFSYPAYKNTKKHSKWLIGLTDDLTYRASHTKKMPKVAKEIFDICTAIIKGQDLSISEFLLPYVTLLLVVYGDTQVVANIEIEIETVLKQNLEDITSDSGAESLKSCYRTIFSIIDYFREWVSEQKRDKKSVRSGASLDDRQKVERFLSIVPTELLAKRTAQCNSYERAIFNLEQSFQTGKMAESEFFGTIRHMYSELDDLDALQGVLKKFSTDTLNDKLMQFQYSEDWGVTHESLAAIAEFDFDDNGRKENKSVQVTSLLKCLDDHCEYEKVLLELGRYKDITLDNDQAHSKEIYLCGLQASIFTGEIDDLLKWTRYSEQSTSITSPGSDLSIYYELAQGLISLHKDELPMCQQHIERASTFVGLALSVSKEISHTKMANYMILLHCLYDFNIMAKLTPGQSLDSCLRLLHDRQDNTMKDFRTRWKIHSLRKAIEQLHPVEEVRAELGNTLVERSHLLREAGRLDLATKSITHALTLGTENSKVNFEFAKLLWAQGEHRQALKSLKVVIEEEQGKPNSPEMDLKYTQWLEESANGSSDEIVKGYRNAANTENAEECGKAQYYLGRYFNKLLDAQMIETPGLKRLEKDFYGDLEYMVIKAYMRSASFSNEYLFEVLPKAVTIWLDYSSRYRDSKVLRSYSSEIIMVKRKDNYSSILKFIKACAGGQVSIYKWYTVLSQLTSRMIHGDPETEGLILSIIGGLAKKYPEVILYSVYSQVQSDSVERRKRGKKICDSLDNSMDGLKSVQVRSAFELLEALKGICQAHPSKSSRGKLKLWGDLKFSFKEGADCRYLALPIRANFDQLHSPVSSLGSRSIAKHKVESFITFRRFEPYVTIVNSMQKPRKLYIIGTDGRKYSILCKPNDDLRKDSKLMEFATVMDRLLQTDFESEKRNLSITSYAVVPLNENMGLIEMVDNVRTIRDIMLTYLQWQGTRFDFAKVKSMLGDSSLPLEDKLVNFGKLKNLYKPVLPIWFADKFPDSVNWYDARNRYIRSCAVMSIVGYLVGMGDRHGDNILLNEITGQILHVDFDCLFDKGKKLQVPERVPFRLTQNMVAAMGVNGYEGTFRKACEVTMKLIRQNENTLMNILETFLYDPILDWKKSSKKRKGADHVGSSSSRLQPQVSMDTIRRKIKGILDPRDLDTGAKDSGGLSVSVNAQVDAVIQQATAEENLAQMYVGWMAFL